MQVSDSNKLFLNGYVLPQYKNFGKNFEKLDLVIMNNKTNVTNVETINLDFSDQLLVQFNNQVSLQNASIPPITK